jgi:hypothetical protein
MTQNDQHAAVGYGMNEHLGADDIAAYLEARLPEAERARVEQHLAACDACRAELIAVSRVLHSRPSRRRWYVPVGIGVAAAALFLIWLMPADNGVKFREPAVTTTVAPVAIAPRGAVRAPVRLIWTRVPHAARYRVTVFDSSGTVIWESQTRDTATAAGVQLNGRYLWQVEAETGFDRWIRSDVVEFSIRP